MSNLNKDLMEGVLTEQFPTFPYKLIQLYIKQCVERDFESAMQSIITKIKLELQKELTGEVIPPSKPAKRHPLDFRRNW